MLHLYEVLLITEFEGPESFLHCRNYFRQEWSFGNIIICIPPKSRRHDGVAACNAEKVLNLSRQLFINFSPFSRFFWKSWRMRNSGGIWRGCALLSLLQHQKSIQNLRPNINYIIRMFLENLVTNYLIISFNFISFEATNNFGGGGHALSFRNSFASSRVADKVNNLMRLKLDF